MEHVHSIIIVKKEDKYLNYFDKRWGTYLFPNIKGNNIEEIRKMLFTNKKVLVNDLSEQFDISRVTIRKDLQQLEDEGIAKRIYGGAMLADCALPSSLSNVNDRTRIALAERAWE